MEYTSLYKCTYKTEYIHENEIKKVEKSSKIRNYLVMRLLILSFYITFIAIFSNFCIIIASQYWKISTINAEMQTSVQRIAELDNEIASLNKKISKAQSIDEIRYKASKQLNMIKRDEKQAIAMSEHVAIKSDNDVHEKQIDSFSFVAAIKSIFNR